MDSQPTRIIEHPLLGTIEPSTPGEWEGLLPFGGHEVRVELLIDEEGLEPAVLEAALQRLDELEAHDRSARSAIDEDAESAADATALLYAQHHTAELSDAVLQELFAATRDQITPKALLSRLVLVRVGIFPESEASQFVLDYSLGSKLTNYVLCVRFDSSGQVAVVDLES
jgi:hypothetical protein